MSEKLSIIIAGFPGLTITVSYREDEPVQNILDRVVNKLGDTPYGDDLSSGQNLYIDGLSIDDYTKSMQYYGLFGTVVTFRSNCSVPGSIRYVSFIEDDVSSVAITEKTSLSEESSKPAGVRKALVHTKLIQIRFSRGSSQQEPGPSTLNVVTNAGDSIKVNYIYGETVEQLKTKISNRVEGSLPVHQQHIYFDGSEIDNEQALDACNIQNGDFLYLLVPRAYLISKYGGFQNLEGAATIYVKTLMGATITCNIALTQTVLSLKLLIQEKQGISPDQQPLIFAGKTLNDNYKPLEYYGVAEESTVYLVFDLRGGGFAPLEFADVSDENGPQKIHLATTAPPGRVVGSGTNIEVKCRCTPRYRVICPQGFGLYELGDTATKCSVCHSARIIPVTCGFLRCQYRFHGIKENGTVYKSEWKTVTDEDQYQLFDPSKEATWQRLGIESRSIGDRTETICTICLEDVFESCTTLRCGHQFHSNCISRWRRNCPNCRASRI